eukprot:CAMPEP_0195526962 /NCGR_PEP_ID=MMETSP0794_2-20130614/28326_1 /TAXON_ID=515487 /ORGANISM="Stephanopyxis turris, Strain CCMP 815" /LENGTH=34 /DNA_ID= /DNA_START= /DNA_END= /DNA_ORIENTATION=
MLEPLRMDDWPPMLFMASGVRALGVPDRPPPPLA